MSWVPREEGGVFTLLKSRYSNLITSGAHLLLLVAAWHIDAPPVWLGCLGAISAISFFSWIANLRRNRAIADTPTSSVASAAQGYVELFGKAINKPEFYATGKKGSVPCVWYRYVTYRRSDDGKWHEIARGVSDTIFALDDGSGRCMIDPEGAEVISSHRNTWHEGDYKHVEEQIFASDDVYVLGEFSTLGGANAPLNQKEDVMALLSDWKKNRAQMLERFDLNKDGEIDQKEWELARRAAQREIEKQHRELRQQPGVHIMRAPTSGQIYLLSNLSPQQLKNRYVRWGWVHLVVFFVAGGYAVATGVKMALW